VIRRFWQWVTASVKVAVINYKWTLQQGSKAARRLTQQEALCNTYLQLTRKCRSSSRTWHCDHQTAQISVDYAVWEALWEMVYHCRSFKSVQKLKSAMFLTARQQLSQAFLDQSISKWRRRLKNIVHCNGGHIKHVCWRGLTIEYARDLKLSRTTWSYSCSAFSFVK